MHKDYVTGFMLKAAELGVDPAALVKTAGSGRLAFRFLNNFANSAKAVTRTGAKLGLRTQGVTKPYPIGRLNQLLTSGGGGWSRTGGGNWDDVMIHPALKGSRQAVAQAVKRMRSQLRGGNIVAMQ